MKVALVCPYAWNRFGGVQSQIRTLARALRRRGHETFVIAPLTLGSTRPAGGDIVVAGRSVSISANGSTAPIAPGPDALVGVRAALRRLAPDVVHLHEPLIPSLSLFALAAASLPSVGTFHAARPASSLYRVFRPVLEPLVGRLTVRTATSEAALALAARYFPGSYVLTPNAVEVERFESGPRLSETGKKSVVFAGRIEPRKGLDVLLEAVAELRDLEVTLLIAGSGSKERELRGLAKRLEVPAQWLGALSEDDLGALYRSATLYCHPATRGESFGIVLLEAMAAGAPVVCSDLPGFRAAAGDAAEFVPAGDAHALGNALRQLLVSEARLGFMRELSRTRAKLFDSQVIAAEVEEIYERALQLDTSG